MSTFVRGMAFLVAIAFDLAVPMGWSAEDGYGIPDSVKVMPVLFVPRDEKVPSPEDQELFLKHLAWTRERFRELLDGDTFELAKPEVVRGDRPLDFYRKQPENGAPDVVAELLAHFKLTRFNNPYVFCIALANSHDGFPAGGGRPINGGFNTGGGMMFIASSQLRLNQHYQATLQHELGHAFGLLHPDAYGYDIKTNPSIMSYSEANFTDGFRPSPRPAILIPEDRRGLALNDRVFSRTTFDPMRDIPSGEAMSPRILSLPPMNLPGHPDFYPKVTTDSGELLRSKVANIVSGEIKPSAGPGITYDPSNMWHSDRNLEKPATLTFEFPFEIELTGLGIHSQHSGLDHEVVAMQFEARDVVAKSKAGVKARVKGKDGSGGGNVTGTAGEFRSIVEQKVTEVDAAVSFPRTRARIWRLTLEPGKSRTLVIRGLRFLDGTEEVIPRQIPYAMAEK